MALAAAGLTFEQMQDMHSSLSGQAGDVSKHSMHSRPATHDQLQSMQSTQSSQAVAASSGSTPEFELDSSTVHALAHDITTAASDPGSTHHQTHSQSTSRQQQQQQQQQDTIDSLYPLEPLPDEATCCQRLLQGYSAAWLGLVPAAPSNGATGPSTVMSGPEAAAVLQPVGNAMNSMCQADSASSSGHIISCVRVLAYTYLPCTGHLMSLHGAMHQVL